MSTRGNFWWDLWPRRYMTTMDRLPTFIAPRTSLIRNHESDTKPKGRRIGDHHRIRQHMRLTMNYRRLLRVHERQYVEVKDVQRAHSNGTLVKFIRTQHICCIACSIFWTMQPEPKAETTMAHDSEEACHFFSFPVSPPSASARFCPNPC